jgi:hypothetical protein
MAKRARVSDPPRCDIVRLNVGGTFFDTTSVTLKRGSGFFASLLDFGSGTFNQGDKDADGRVFVDRSAKLFGILLESWRTSLRPPQNIINAWKQQLLEECRYFVADDTAARIMGRTCDADLSPACRRIALDEREMAFTVVNVFEAHLERKDRAQLQLPPLLLEPLVREESVLAGTFYDCKARLNVLCGGLLLALERDPLIAKFCVIAGGAACAALTSCGEAGAPVSHVFVICFACACARIVLLPPSFCRNDALPLHLQLPSAPLFVSVFPQVTLTSFSWTPRLARSRLSSARSTMSS